MVSGMRRVGQVARCRQGQGSGRSDVFDTLKLGEGQGEASEAPGLVQDEGCGFIWRTGGAPGALATRWPRLIYFLRDRSGGCADNGLEEGRAGDGRLTVSVAVTQEVAVGLRPSAIWEWIRRWCWGGGGGHEAEGRVRGAPSRPRGE